MSFYNMFLKNRSTITLISSILLMCTCLACKANRSKSSKFTNKILNKASLDSISNNKIKDIKHPKEYVFVGNYNDNFISVFSVSSGGLFEPLKNAVLPVGHEAKSITSADINSDGQPDIIIANAGPSEFDSLSVFLNTATTISSNTSFPKMQTIAPNDASMVKAVDINNDGKPDLIASNNIMCQISVLLNKTESQSSKINFAPADTFSTGSESAPSKIVVADMNEDGKPDIIIGNVFNGTISIFLNTMSDSAKTPSFSTRQDFKTDHSILVQAADLNGDHKPDLVVSEMDPDSIWVMLNTTPANAKNMSFGPQKSFKTGVYPSALAIEDINGDEKPDIIETNDTDNTVSIFLNITKMGSKNPHFAQRKNFAVGKRPEAVVAEDLNDDGKPDLVIANSGSNTISVLFNTTTTKSKIVSFAPQKTFPTGKRPSCIAIGHTSSSM